MAFNSFMSSGFGGELRPQDLFDDIDLDDDEYNVPPQDRARQPEPNPAQLELERIRKRNEELERQMQDTRVEAARQYGEVKAALEMMQRQGNSEIKSPEQANEFVNFWGQGAGQQQSQQQQQAPVQQVDVQQTVQNVLNNIAAQTAQAQAEERALAERFKNEHPTLLAIPGAGNEAYHEWERLKALRGDLPASKRYELMVQEVKRRFSNVAAGRQAGTDMKPTYIPTSQMVENVHPEVQHQINLNPRSEKERLIAKSKDTARRVANFRKDQTHRTSISNYAAT